ncbi:MAG: glycosyltransferase [Verrucomicrobiales bacterium]|nr:glycosyltransferase [Verrucomicrobiales bacterium]
MRRMRAGSPQASIIISTYNWPAALSLVLRSALSQSESDFELIIADDGSKPETAEAVASTLAGSPIPWCHVRQEDTGFRQSRVRNLGVRHARGTLLIFVDHDVLLHRDFVADHLRFNRPETFLVGKRCFLPAAESERLIAAGRLEGSWWPAAWMAGLENRKNAVHLPMIGSWLARPKTFQTALRGCNLSARREDFLRVDGFDELYDGVWGREDSDFCYRLFHTGRRCRNLWFAGLQAHLHHRTVKRTQRDHLDDELDRMRAERRERAVRGFSQMDGEGRIVACSAEFREQTATG